MSSPELPLSNALLKTAAEQLLQQPGKAIFDFLQQDREMAARLQGLAEQMDSQLLEAPGIAALTAEPLASSLAEKLQQIKPSQQNEAAHKPVDQADRAQTEEARPLASEQISSDAIAASPGGRKAAKRKTKSGGSQTKRDKPSEHLKGAERMGKKHKAPGPMKTKEKTASANQIRDDSVKPRPNSKKKPAIARIAGKQIINAEQARKRLAARAERAGASTAWRTAVIATDKTTASTKSSPSDVKKGDEIQAGLSASPVEQQIEHQMKKVAPNLKRRQKKPDATSINKKTNPRHLKADEIKAKSGFEKKQIGQTSPSLGHAHPVTTDEREQGIDIASRAQSVGGLRGLAARASGPLGQPGLPRPGDEPNLQQSIKAEPPLSAPTGAQQIAQHSNGLPTSSGTAPVARVSVAEAGDNTSAGAQRNLAADIAEVLVEEARRAGIDVEQFRP